jgi:hypothetical protein
MNKETAVSELKLGSELYLLYRQEYDHSSLSLTVFERIAKIIIREYDIAGRRQDRREGESIISRAKDYVENLENIVDEHDKQIQQLKKLASNYRQIAEEVYEQAILDLRECIVDGDFVPSLVAEQKAAFFSRFNSEQSESKRPEEKLFVKDESTYNPLTGQPFYVESKDAPTDEGECIYPDCDCTRILVSEEPFTYKKGECKRTASAVQLSDEQKKEAAKIVEETLKPEIVKELVQTYLKNTQVDLWEIHRMLNQCGYLTALAAARRYSGKDAGQQTSE